MKGITEYLHHHPDAAPQLIGELRGIRYAMLDRSKRNPKESTMWYIRARKKVRGNPAPTSGKQVGSKGPYKSKAAAVKAAQALADKLPHLKVTVEPAAKAKSNGNFGKDIRGSGPWSLAWESEPWASSIRKFHSWRYATKQAAIAGISAAFSQGPAWVTLNKNGREVAEYRASDGGRPYKRNPKAKHPRGALAKHLKPKGSVRSSLLKIKGKTKRYYPQADIRHHCRDAAGNFIPVPGKCVPFRRKNPAEGNLPSWPGASGAYSKAYKILSVMSRSPEMDDYIDALNRGDEERIKGYNLQYMHLLAATKKRLAGSFRRKNGAGGPEGWKRVYPPTAGKKVHIRDADGDMIYTRLLDDGKSNVIAFESGSGFITRDQIKREHWSIHPHWPKTPRHRAESEKALSEKRARRKNPKSADAVGYLSSDMKTIGDDNGVPVFRVVGPPTKRKGIRGRPGDYWYSGRAVGSDGTRYSFTSPGPTMATRLKKLKGATKNPQTWTGPSSGGYSAEISTRGGPMGALIYTVKIHGPDGSVYKVVKPGTITDGRKANEMAEKAVGALNGSASVLGIGWLSKIKNPKSKRKSLAKRQAAIVAWKEKHIDSKLKKKAARTAAKTTRKPSAYLGFVKSTLPGLIASGVPAKQAMSKVAAEWRKLKAKG